MLYISRDKFASALLRFALQILGLHVFSLA